MITCSTKGMSQGKRSPQEIRFTHVYTSDGFAPWKPILGEFIRRHGGHVRQDLSSESFVEFNHTDVAKLFFDGGIWLIDRLIDRLSWLIDRLSWLRCLSWFSSTLSRRRGEGR